MSFNILRNWNPSNIEKYKKLLTIAGSLSKLFSDNQAPYLNYRVLENIYCYVFGAENCARSDNAIDAVLEIYGNRYGVGIKTFIADARWQKIAEMDALHEVIREINGIDKARYVSTLRNKRISLARSIYRFEKGIYHCVLRKNKAMIVQEEKMNEINVDKIVILSDNGSSLKFKDNATGDEYNFLKAKSTLCKAFNYEEEEGLCVPVRIIEDPISWLLNTAVPEKSCAFTQTQGPEETYPYVYLPLYSPRSADREPSERSGLNQWNAKGRSRHEDEAYIPIPAWIHKAFSGFFPERDIDFELLLPNGNMLSAKVCQDNGKALMSNPNRDLGHWLLREVLMVEPDHLVTRKTLDEAGVDTVIVWKTGAFSYSMDFRPTGTYENFKAGYLGEE